MQDLNIKLDLIERELLLIGNLFYCLENKRGLRLLANFSSNLNELILTISNNFKDKVQLNLIQTLNGYFVEIIDDIKKQDYISIGDLLIYKILPEITFLKNNNNEKRIIRDYNSYNLEYSERLKIISAENQKFTLRVNDILLHSEYEPDSVSEVFINNCEDIFVDKKVVCVYGLAFGHHINALLTKLDNNTLLHIFDMDEEVFIAGKQYGAYEQFINNGRVNLHIGSTKKNYEKLVEILRIVDNVIIYTPSLNTLSTEYAELKEVLENFQIGVESINYSRELMYMNYELNVEYNPRKMIDFYNQYTFKNEKIIMVAAGPSLDDNIETLKKLQCSIKIFCVGTALRTLIQNNIKPYMICIIDPNDEMEKQFIGLEDLDIPLCFLNTASNKVISKYLGPKYMFYNDENKFVKDIYINTGKTVAIPTIDIAVKGNASEVILVGQDLAFIEGKSHSVVLNENNIILGLENKSDEAIGMLKSVRDNQGNFLYTNSGFLNFKRFIEVEIKNNPQVKFTNCSKGARIEGTEWCPLEKYL